MEYDLDLPNTDTCHHNMQYILFKYRMCYITSYFTLYVRIRNAYFIYLCTYVSTFAKTNLLMIHDTAKADECHTDLV